MEERSLSNIKKSLSVALNMLHHVEDLTNYDIKDLGKAITLIQGIDIDKEFKKYHVKIKELKGGNNK